MYIEHQRMKEGGGLPLKSKNFHSPPRRWLIIFCSGPISAIDAYALALLIFNLFNPSVSHPPFLSPPYNPPQTSTRGTIPPSLWPSFKKMLNPNPKGRMTPKALLDVGMTESLGEDGGFFKANGLFKICEGLGNFGLMTDVERATLLRCATCQAKRCKLTDTLHRKGQS